jgi:hypothetical protein
MCTRSCPQCRRLPARRFLFPSDLSTKRALAEAELELASCRSALSGAAADLGTTNAALRVADDALLARRSEAAGLAQRLDAAAREGYAGAKRELMHEGASCALGGGEAGGGSRQTGRP